MRIKKQKNAWRSISKYTRRKEIARYLDKYILFKLNEIECKVRNYQGDIMSLTPKTALKQIFPNVKPCKATIYYVNELLDLGKCDPTSYTTFFKEYKDALKFFKKCNKELLKNIKKSPDEYEIVQNTNHTFEIQFNCYEKWASIHLAKAEVH